MSFIVMCTRTSTRWTQRSLRARCGRPPSSRLGYDADVPLTRLSALPILPGVWEIALFPAPFEVEGVVLRAGVIVAEADTKHLRMLAPLPAGAPLVEVLREAFTGPAKPTRAGRPSGVRVSSPELLVELRPLLQEAGVIGAVTDQLPAITEAMASLLTSMGGPVAPGLTADLPIWREALRELAALAPWTRLGDDVNFLLSDGGGEPRVAVIIGRRGENRGIVVYPSIAGLDQHRALKGTGQIGQLDMIALLMEPSEELSAGERAACKRAHLIFPTRERGIGPLHGKAYVARAGGFRAPDLDEQRALLRAVHAVVALCRTDLGPLADGEPRRRTVDGFGEPVAVHGGRGLRPTGAALPVELPPYFTAYDLRIIFSTASPAGGLGPPPSAKPPVQDGEGPCPGDRAVPRRSSRGPCDRRRTLEGGARRASGRDVLGHHRPDARRRCGAARQVP